MHTDDRPDFVATYAEGEIRARPGVRELRLYFATRGFGFAALEAQKTKPSSKPSIRSWPSM